MLKKFSLVLVTAFLFSQPSFGAARGTEVLAVCAKSTDRAQSFQIIGESKKFIGLRLGPVFSEVSLVNLSGETFPGHVTLSKIAPYQYALYGQFVGKAAAGEYVAPATIYYGTSAGSQMLVQENLSGKTITLYQCDLNMSLLATP